MSTKAPPSCSSYLDPLAYQNHFARMLGKHEGRDKVVKFGFAATKFIAEMSGDEGARKASSTISDARTVYSLLNVPGGFYTTFKSLQLLIDLANSIFADCKNYFEARKAAPDSKFNSTPFQLKKKPKEDSAQWKPSDESAFSDRMRNPDTFGQKLLAAFKELTGGVISGAGFILGFGVLRPINFVNKHWPDSVSDSAKDLGQKFCLVMGIKDISAIIGGITELVRAGIIYKDTDDRSDMDTEALYEVIVREVLKMLEKGFELGSKIIVVGNLPAPPVLKLVFDLVGAGFGICVAWVDSATYTKS